MALQRLRGSDVAEDTVSENTKSHRRRKKDLLIILAAA